jgi:hypothetical protein
MNPNLGIIFKMAKRVNGKVEVKVEKKENLPLGNTG